MTTIASAFAAAYRDYNIDGVAASGKYEPEKDVLRALGDVIQSALGLVSMGIGIADTILDLPSAGPGEEGRPIILVTDDGTSSNNTLWVWRDPSWEKFEELYDGLVTVVQPLIDVALAELADATDLLGAAAEQVAVDADPDYAHKQCMTVSDTDYIATATGRRGGAPVSPPAYETARRAQRIMARAALRNPIDLPDGGDALATVTNVAYGVGVGALTRVLTDDVGLGLIRLLGGQPIYIEDIDGWMFWTVRRRTGGSLSPSYPEQGALGWRLAIRTDAPALMIAYLGGKTRVIIDDQYVSRTPVTALGGGYNRLLIEPAGERKMRTIVVEFSRDCALGSTYQYIDSINISPADIVEPIRDDEILRVAVQGDSITEGSNASYEHNIYAMVSAYRLGGALVDMRNLGIGARGWVNDASGSASGEQYTMLESIADIDQARHDVILAASGINDSAETYADVRAAVAAWMAAVRARQPQTIIGMMGSWAPATGPASVLHVEQAIRDAHAMADDPYSFFAAVSTDLEPWTTAANSVVDNADGSDGVHPTDQGHLKRGILVSDAARSAITSILEGAAWR